MRDKWGNFVTGISHKILGIFSPKVIEAYATKSTISSLIQLKVPKIILDRGVENRKIPIYRSNSN